MSEDRLDLQGKIRDLIASRGLGAGDRLPAERALAVEFGVSRSRLREDIQQLVSQGHLVSRRGGGHFVAVPEPGEPVRAALLPLASLARSEAGYWHDVMEIRLSLEGDTAAHAALRASEEDKARLTKLADAFHAASADPAALAHADAAFHLGVAQAAHNVVLVQVMDGLQSLLEASISESLLRLYHLPGMIDELDAQHRAILDAILGGEAETARAAATRHLAFVTDRLRMVEETEARQRRAARAHLHMTAGKGPSA
ncbi:transcriptional regulator GntR family [Novosphingobium nitrogenifigens DSM 19370]|uniref:Transcriptional regulator GntR family n=1 Tax=Novosphingobium nitrogenifigens DSM 19370 TaxID=983920 RepID=F1Z399_9SPHN|nr:FCD domain-containing protein [Novosphingobium nitrogenifigens]EGD60914.1 transcriptional regulator GntR family [Novosphingobium nitrogenifigens DSM 19370]